MPASRVASALPVRLSRLAACVRDQAAASCAAASDKPAPDTSAVAVDWPASRKRAVVSGTQERRRCAVYKLSSHDRAATRHRLEYRRATEAYFAAHRASRLARRPARLGKPV